MDGPVACARLLRGGDGSRLARPGMGWRAESCGAGWSRLRLCEGGGRSGWRRCGGWWGLDEGLVEVGIEKGFSITKDWTEGDGGGMAHGELMRGRWLVERGIGKGLRVLS